jgi:hypothetical protein
VDAQSLYVYALLDRRVAPPRLPRRRRLEVIEVAGVAAAVEHLDEPLPLNEQTLREQHQIVVRLARTAKAILPVRFGTLVDRAELEGVIEARQDVLQQALRDVHGKVQMTVRVFGRPKRLPAASAAASGAEYLRARAAQHAPTLPKLAHAIVEAVRPFVSAEVIDAGRGNVLVTINHLIDRKVASRYLSIVKPIDQKPTAHGPRSTVHVVSGPWPPFAFAPDLLSSALPLERLRR